MNDSSYLQQFNLVIHVKLRDFINSQSSENLSARAILKKLLPLENELFINLDNPDTCLFLIDGYDEARDNSAVNDFLKELYSRNNAFIITSRPFSSSPTFESTTEKSFLSSLHNIIEIESFDINQSLEFSSFYFRNHVRAEKCIKKTAAIINGPGEQLCSSPLALLIVCFCVKHDSDNLQIDEFWSITTLYEKVSKIIINLEVETRKKKSRDFHGITWDEFSVLYFELFQYLSKEIIGFPGFDLKVFEKVKNENKKFKKISFQDVQDFGFVKKKEKSEEKNRKLIIEETGNYVEFIHYTFIEYFAAIYFVNHLENNNQIEVLKNNSLLMKFLLDRQYDLFNQNFMEFIFKSLKKKEYFDNFLRILGDNEANFDSTSLENTSYYREYQFQCPSFREEIEKFTDNDQV